jgi:hypothetical protein
MNLELLADMLWSHDAELQAQAEEMLVSLDEEDLDQKTRGYLHRMRLYEWLEEVGRTKDPGVDPDVDFSVVLNTQHRRMSCPQTLNPRRGFARDLTGNKVLHVNLGADDWLVQARLTHGKFRARIYDLQYWEWGDGRDAILLTLDPPRHPALR